MEALEGLSNQYRRQSGYSNMVCFGKCTIETQIAWATDVQAIYDGSLVEKMTNRLFNMGLYLEYAQKAKEGYKHGDRNEAWMWGNVNANELVQLGNEFYYDDHRVIEKDDSEFPGTQYFIVWSDWLELKLPTPAPAVN